MTIYRAFIAFIAAALAIAASSTASAVVYDLNTVQTVGIDTVDGRAYFTADVSEAKVNTGTSFETRQDGQATWKQRVSDLKTVVVDGASYYAFLLDVNDSNSSSGSIGSVKIYTSKFSLTSAASLQNYGKLQFNLDGSEDVTLSYNDSNGGTGQGEVTFLLPTSALADVSSNDYFYLTETFGTTSGAVAGGGGESARGGGPVTFFIPIPETNAVIPILAVLGVLVAGPFVRRCFHP